MKELQVLGVMRALLVAGMSVAEEDQRGQVPRKNVSAGAIWHETIRFGGTGILFSACGKQAETKDT